MRSMGCLGLGTTAAADAARDIAARGAAAVDFPARLSYPQFVQTTAPSCIGDWHCGQRGASASIGAELACSARSYSAPRPSSSGGTSAGGAAATGAATWRGGGADLAVGDATAAGETFGAATRSVAPHAGQRAFLPTAVAGALSFLPQAQATRMELSVVTTAPLSSISEYCDQL